MAEDAPKLSKKEEAFMDAKQKGNDAISKQEVTPLPLLPSSLFHVCSPPNTLAANAVPDPRRAHAHTASTERTGISLSLSLPSIPC